MKHWKSFYPNCEGSSAVEFAVAAPVILLMLFGILQLGVLFEARTGLKFAIDESARYAMIYPRPDDASIIKRFQDKQFGLVPSSLSTSIAHGTNADGDYADISAKYIVDVNFIFFRAPALHLAETRRAFQNTAQ
ncbi:TadE family protein [Sphingomonas oligophenolica]|uniref:Pilus assembly protein n=1 Tax=Sphingomonas oligophenolica TaxID=301154 RepID=A0A502CM23_9SPHN|nr:TadE family protein [Sphingomonas oligophenolica]TPG13189.1 pilus assembly protein [Sphingomonas oligophenolica]